MSLVAIETETLNNFEFPDQEQQRRFTRSIVGYAGLLATLELRRKATIEGLPPDIEYSRRFYKRQKNTDNPKVYVRAIYEHGRDYPPYLAYALAKRPWLQPHALTVKGELEAGGYKSAKAARSGFRSSYIDAIKTSRWIYYKSQSKKTGEMKVRRKREVIYRVNDRLEEDAQKARLIWKDKHTGLFKSSRGHFLAQNKPQWEDWMRRTWTMAAPGYAGIIAKEMDRKFVQMLREQYGASNPTTR